MKMTVLLRTVATALVTLSITLGVTGTVLAADPTTPEPVIGGQLEAGPTQAIVTSNSTNPVMVTLEGDSVVADPSSFTLDPGEQQIASLTGDAIGTLRAHMTQVDAAGGDASSVTLQVDFSKLPDPTLLDQYGMASLWAIVFALALVFLMRRYKPWRWRITVSTR